MTVPMTAEGGIKFGFRPRSSNWTSLRLLNISRVVVAAILFSQSFLPDSPLLQIRDIQLYAWTSFAYLLLALVFTVASWIERRNYQTQVSLQIYSDILAIVLLMHACGGVSSGLGMLLLIPIAISALLSRESLALVFAALGTVALLTEYIYAINFTDYRGNSTQVGLLGIILFITAIVTQTLTRRIRRGEEQIQKHKLDAANLAALNAEILQKMDAGVLALDSEDRVRHINDTARQLLHRRLSHDLNALQPPFPLSDVLPALQKALERWRVDPNTPKCLLPSTTGGIDLQASFHPLSSTAHQGTLIFLEDVSSLKQQMQQAKLMSLGQLTANIAHEIRNPLGAISHAAELLAENRDLPPTELRLSEIIHQHSQRINHIIEDIMQISRGQMASPETVDLRQWLPQFLDNLCIGTDICRQRFLIEWPDGDTRLDFDRGHLERILANLCQNALNHGANEEGEPEPVTLRVRRPEPGQLCIDVIDRGPGLAEGQGDKIFEPFYTTRHQGSGLGLYIVAQLAELNNARVSAANNADRGAQFTLCTHQTRP